MRDSGCDRVALGLESVSQETLDGFDKSQSVADIVRALDVLHSYGIKTHGMFVLGADSDTPDTIRETARFAREHDISTLMLNILTPLPGTPLFDELDAQGRIFDRRWDLFDGQHVVFRPRGMTPQKLQAEVWGAYARFYSFRQWLKYLTTFRYGTMALYSWYWVFLRRWRRERGNREYLEMLRHLRPAAGVPATAEDRG
jgi:anaerobic magnesium-protoporphyrin IX monomethyl ester cyclase